jgi:hypothetical protein
MKVFLTVLSLLFVTVVSAQTDTTSHMKVPKYYVLYLTPEEAQELTVSMQQSSLPVSLFVNIQKQFQSELDAANKPVMPPRHDPPAPAAKDSTAKH